MDNSQAGSINETYDLFLRHGLHLVGETVVRVDHCLLALPGSSIDDVREVVSHPQAIAQCEEFLSVLDVTVRAEYNTAGAAKLIAENRLDQVAAIASRRAAELYGLEVLADRIQTYPDNDTRFGALARPLAAREAGQVVIRVRSRPRRGLALSVPWRLRRAASEFDETRVAAATGTPVGVRLLRRCRRRGAGSGNGRRPRGPERARNVHAAPRHLRRRGTPNVIAPGHAAERTTPMPHLLATLRRKSARVRPCVMSSSRLRPIQSPSTISPSRKRSNP